MVMIQPLVVGAIAVSRISKLSIWKCPKCKTFNEDYMDECECGFINKYDKKPIKEEIEDFKFPNKGFSDEVY